MYARGILFGKMKYELGDHATVKCPESGLEVDIEFKVKGWVGGSYNAIGGFIKDTKTGKNLYELTGHWNTEMFIKDLTTGKKELFFDALHSKPSFPLSRPLEEQDARESQKLWNTTTQAIKKADQKTATDEKSRIEDEQRREAAEREKADIQWAPKLFRVAPPGDEQNLDWILDAQVDGTGAPEKIIDQILSIAPILPGQTPSQRAQSDKAKPTQQGKEAPPQRAGNDLIDFGQNDGAVAPGPSKSSVPADQPSAGTATSPSANGLQTPLQPARSEPATQSRPGEPIRRMDSMGGEDDVFMDAES